MNDVAELAQYITVHAGAQGIPPARYRPLLAAITHDGVGPGSWVHEWSTAAAALERDGRLLEASRYHNMARFPFVDGPARREALDRCVDVFARWAREHTPLRRVDLDLPGGPLGCWTVGLEPGAPQPLLLVCGGIVSVKEQWAPLLLRARALGMAGLVTELPGVGENTASYGPHSVRMWPQILDALAERGVEVSRAYACALSFSGHLALAAAPTDRRLRGLVLAGAPVHDFFTDAAWQERLPRVTVDTLAHLTGRPADTALASMRGWALPAEPLRTLTIPAHVLVSRRDEIIPPGDVRYLRRNLRHLHIRSNDDVHGSPGHVAESGLWLVLSLLRMLRADRRQRAALRWQLGMARARRGLSARPA
ncbi:esterase FrsA [Frankia sp. AiPs1]|uniref:alpha/beta hydrolase n=1 Tax=Frankia sp. AiPa1 TaxID=573492 RepID=UPI00202B8F86|nr:alpha/beta hydrolase [Frankia sp. AiPa1]MCL9762944.1 alpha/beta hydrolase [Frankia sp. AiPa1]